MRSVGQLSTAINYHKHFNLRIDWLILLELQYNMLDFHSKQRYIHVGLHETYKTFKKLK